jgi:hypothetical protein
VILLAIICFVAGCFVLRPALWTAAAVLLVLAVLFFVFHVGAYGTWPYVPNG